MMKRIEGLSDVVLPKSRDGLEIFRNWREDPLEKKTGVKRILLNVNLIHDGKVIWGNPIIVDSNLLSEDKDNFYIKGESVWMLHADKRNIGVWKVRSQKTGHVPVIRAKEGLYPEAFHVLKFHSWDGTENYISLVAEQE